MTLNEKNTSAIIIVHGLPCTGKTTVARKIAAEFSFPLIEKDGFKEILFNTLGWSDREWSKRLGHASLELIFYVLRSHLTTHQPLIIDCNFHPQFHNQRFQEITAGYDFLPLQVLCWAEGQTLYRRFCERTGARHPGHVDETLTEELLQPLLAGKADPLSIGGDIYELQTTDFEAIDYSMLFQWLEENIRKNNPGITSCFTSN
jgi:hypothetical protein